MTWVDDQHTGCAVGDAASHGWCVVTRKSTCTWCGHLDCGLPRGETWPVATRGVLEDVAQERVRQMAQHGDAMRHLPDGTGPDAEWLSHISFLPASDIQTVFRKDYDSRRAVTPNRYGQLTRMHLVREEIAEAFELDGDSPEFYNEMVQVAALCVQWLEYKDRP